MRIEELLAEKGREAVVVSGDQTSVEAAAQQMARHDTSALVVVAEQDGRPIGVFSAGDLVRCREKYPARSLETIQLSDVMSRPAIVAQCDDRVRDVLGSMMSAAIGHLPVVKEKRLVGMLAFSDLARHHIEALESEIHLLHDYIHSLRDAAQD